MKIQYYIVTRNRWDKQITLSYLPDQIKRDTFLVCEENQISKYQKYNKKFIAKENILPFPKRFGKNLINGYGCVGDKKQWIFENTKAECIYFLDDDFKFHVRKKEKLFSVKGKDMINMFAELNRYLSLGFAHVALSPRFGNNRIEEEVLFNSRGVGFVGYNVKILKEQKIELNRLLLMSDFDTTLSLLEKGFGNVILYLYTYDQKTNSLGGCGLYRDSEAMKKCAYELRSFHPQFVTVKQKKTKQAWEGFESKVRYDVTVQWKKAFSYGQKKGQINIKNFL